MRYSYIAKSLKGEPKTGVLEVPDKRALARILRREGYILISAQEEDGKKKKIKISLPFLNKISLAEKLMFVRNLQVMTAAGVSLPRSLKVLSEQAKSKKFKKVILKIADEIIKGKNLSDSVGSHPNVFSDLFINMVKVGEEAGTLEEVLGILAQQMEKSYKLRATIKGAMIYPAVIVIAMIIVGTLMLVLIIPKLAQTFGELGVELPLTTRAIIAAGNFLARFWYFLPLIFIFLLFLPGALLKNKKVKLITDKLILKIPAIGSLVRKTNSAYTVRTLSSLIDSGVPIVRSLEITAGVLGNIYYKKAILKAAEQVKKGAKLAEALREQKNVYSVLVVQMIEVGEETGETSKILKKLAEFFEEEVANATKNLSAVIEPVLMLLIGAAVGFFAISMIQPIYGMLGAL